MPIRIPSQIAVDCKSVNFSLEFDTSGFESLESDNGIYLGTPQCANAKLTVKPAHKNTAISYITPRNQIPLTNCYISWIIDELSPLMD